GGVARNADLAVHRADIDDLAPAQLHHAGCDRARQGERRGEVGRDDVVPLLVGDLDGSLVERDARIVDEDVDRTERGADGRHDGVDLVPAGDVEPEAAREAAYSANLGR